MKIVLTGGGTGGHITPILAVAESLKSQAPQFTTVYVGERGSKFAELTDKSPHIDEKYMVLAGKYRRYSGVGVWEKVTDIRTMLLNLRDFGFFMVGVVQAWLLLGRVRPDVVFLKGGFVGVPVGLAAAVRKIPIVTHDSDAIPGLANRLVSRWARVHAVAMPVETYDYPSDKTVQVGVLVEPAYKHVTKQDQAAFRAQIDIPVAATMLLVTGGSLGAVRINRAIAGCVDGLLTEFDDLYVVHQVGKGNLTVYNTSTHDRLIALEFLQPMHAYMGAADVVVTRGSANTIAEIGVQGKPAIVIPSPYLANGHQMKNAELLRERNTALVVDEAELDDAENGLRSAIVRLLTSKHERTLLARALHEDTRPDAAPALAKILVDLARAEERH